MTCIRRLTTFAIVFALLFGAPLYAGDAGDSSPSTALVTTCKPKINTAARALLVLRSIFSPTYRGLGSDPALEYPVPVGKSNLHLPEFGDLSKRKMDNVAVRWILQKIPESTPITFRTKKGDVFSASKIKTENGRTYVEVVVKRKGYRAFLNEDEIVAMAIPSDLIPQNLPDNIGAAAKKLQPLGKDSIQELMQAKGSEEGPREGKPISLIPDSLKLRMPENDSDQPIMSFKIEGVDKPVSGYLLDRDTLTIVAMDYTKPWIVQLDPLKIKSIAMDRHNTFETMSIEKGSTVWIVSRSTREILLHQKYNGQSAEGVAVLGEAPGVGEIKSIVSEAYAQKQILDRDNRIVATTEEGKDLIGHKSKLLEGAKKQFGEIDSRGFEHGGGSYRISDGIRSFWFQEGSLPPMYELLGDVARGDYDRGFAAHNFVEISFSSSTEEVLKAIQALKTWKRIGSTLGQIEFNLRQVGPAPDEKFILSIKPIHFYSKEQIEMKVKELLTDPAFRKTQYIIK